MKDAIANNEMETEEGGPCGALIESLLLWYKPAFDPDTTSRLMREVICAIDITNQFNQIRDFRLVCPV